MNNLIYWSIAVVCLISYVCMAGSDEGFPSEFQGRRGICGFDLEIHDVNRLPVTSLQSNNVVAAFSRVETACRKCCLSELQKSIADIPSCVTNLNAWAYRDVSRRLTGLVWENFLAPQGIREFDTLEDLIAFLAVGKCTVRFLGDTYLKRAEYPEELMAFDLYTLKTLKHYAEQLNTEGPKEILDKIQMMIRDWEDGIDSESGFTHLYMRHQVALQYPHVEEGCWTVEKLFEIVRRNADGLIKIGHTPRWLDKEFVLPIKAQSGK